MEEKLGLGKRIIEKISSFFDTWYFAACLGLVEILCYYLALDLVLIIVISLCISFTFLFKKNLNCVFVQFLFMSSMISVKNSPVNYLSENNSTYYFEPSVYITCIVFASIPVFIILCRAIQNFFLKKIRFDALIISTIFLGLTFITAGLLQRNYNSSDVMFGSFMFFFFVILFIAVQPSVLIEKKTVETVSKQVSFYLVVPLIEMLVFYIDLFIGGNSLNSRQDVFLGWGNRNTLGMLFSVCLPFIAYLIKNGKDKKFKIFSFCLGALTIVFTIFTFSRQAYLSILVLIFGYLLFKIVHAKEKEKSKYEFIFAGLIGAIILIIGICKLVGFLDKFEINNVDARLMLWQESIEQFNKNPIFGSGFFYLNGDPNINLESIMPYCCHNTILQMASSCGFFGLIAYIAYRSVTIKSILNSLTYYKMYIVASLSVIVLMSLVDIHLFDFFGTAIYVVLLAMAVYGYRKKDEIELEKNNQERYEL